MDADIQILKDLFDADSWAMMYECIFADDDTSFFPVSLIKSCVDYNYSYHSPDINKILFCGYDIGRKKDLSVLSALEPNNSKYELAIQDVYKQATFDSQKTILKEHLSSFKKAYIKYRYDRSWYELSRKYYK